jgi:hypothetical protein
VFDQPTSKCVREFSAGTYPLLGILASATRQAHCTRCVLCQSSVHHKEKQSSMCLSLFLRHRFRTQSRRMSCSSVTLCSTQQIMASASPTVPLGLRPTGNSHLTQADMILCCVERSRAIRRMGRPEPQHLLCISGARRVQVESSVAYFAHFCKPCTFPRPDIHRRLPHCWSALRI